MQSKLAFNFFLSLVNFIFGTWLGMLVATVTEMITERSRSIEGTEEIKTTYASTPLSVTNKKINNMNK